MALLFQNVNACCAGSVLTLGRGSKKTIESRGSNCLSMSIRHSPQLMIPAAQHCLQDHDPEGYSIPTRSNPKFLKSLKMTSQLLFYVSVVLFLSSRTTHSDKVLIQEKGKGYFSSKSSLVPSSQEGLSNSLPLSFPLGVPITMASHL
jgi:hypothetical protein